jgi:hypothetical protein
MIYEIEQGSPILLTSKRVTEESMRELLLTAIQNTLDEGNNPSGEARMFDLITPTGAEPAPFTMEQWEQASPKELRSMKSRLVDDLMETTGVQQFLQDNARTQLKPSKETEVWQSLLQVLEQLPNPNLEADHGWNYTESEYQREMVQ